MDIRKSYEESAKQSGRLPNYANCTITFLDTPDSLIDVVIKLSSDVDPDEDDEIFFYTDGIDDFISLTQEEGVEDFIVRADYPINFY